jgi:hypothetical protein
MVSFATRRYDYKNAFIYKINLNEKIKSSI